MNNPPTILFLCVANSARSQMAEGLAREMYPFMTFRSAGSEPTQPNPFAVAAMNEIGIDISTHTSDSVSDVKADEIDLVITLCAEEVCPVLLSDAMKMHWAFEDPDRKNEEMSDEDRLRHFRETRDLIKHRLKLLSVRFTGLAPIFPTRDIEAAIALYSKLGFMAHLWDGPGPPTYGFVSLGSCEFHLTQSDDLDPTQNRAGAYLYATNVADLYDVWKTLDLPGELTAPESKPWGLLEMVYFDADGNTLRIGEPAD